VRRRLAALVACVLVAGLSATGASASSSLQLGVYDEATTLFPANPTGFKTLTDLRAKVLRLNLYWFIVSPTRPQFVANPFDPAYDWSMYDRAIREADRRGIKVLLSIWGTPGWANGGKGQNYAPSSYQDMKDFADAAAHRYSGHYAANGTTANPLPAVTLWMAWNEPNSPRFLKPQGKLEGGRWVPASPEIYAVICNAIFRGVHKAGHEEGVPETVACGATNPRGNNIFKGKRASVSPILFLRGMKDAGADFDCYAHHPYAPTPHDTPTTPPAARTTVTLANINTLIAEVDRLYPGKCFWITEYGYQTNPPDHLFGVSWAVQAAYLRKAVGIARANPRIDMFLWFLLKDEAKVSGWQSGLIDASGKKKPAYSTFRALSR
jgi:hypothetical protein